MSLHNRHLVDRSHVKVDNKFVSLGFKQLDKLINIKLEERATYQEIIAHYTGGKKKLYHNAMQRLYEGKFDWSKHTIVKMFVKPDRWPESEVRSKAPRAIQFRSREYNLQLASWLQPLEQRLYEHIEWNGTRVVAKGLTPRERAKLLLSKVKNYTNPKFVNIDHAKFDSTVTKGHLKLLHKLYRRLCGKGIQRLLKAQLTNRCYSKHNIKYIAHGTRMSGDYDTALGNTLINIACLLQCFKGLKFDFILDGDDAVVILEGCDVPKLSVEKFRRFGFTTKLEVVNSLYGVEFCQSRLVNAGGWTFVRNPIRAVSNAMAVRKKYNMKWMARYLAGWGRTELSVSAGIPILQQQAERLAVASDNPFFDEDMKRRMVAHKFGPSKVKMKTRVSLFRAWGIPVDVQLALETLLPPLTLRLNGKNDLKYDIKSLFESWARMASVGCTCYAGRWGYSWASVP